MVFHPQQDYLLADNCVLYRVIKSDKDTKQLQVDFDALQEWETKWIMHFNPSKCNVIHFCPKWKEADEEYFINILVFGLIRTSNGHVRLTRW